MRLSSVVAGGPRRTSRRKREKKTVGGGTLTRPVLHEVRIEPPRLARIGGENPEEQPGRDPGLMAFAGVGAMARPARISELMHVNDDGREMKMGIDA